MPSGGISTSINPQSTAVAGPISFGPATISGGNTGISGTMVAVIVASVLLVGGLALYLVKKS